MTAATPTKAPTSMGSNSPMVKTPNKAVMPVIVESKRRNLLRQKLDPAIPTKYEKDQLPISLDDFMTSYLSSGTEAWEQALVDELKEWIDDRISTHIKGSSLSRRVLSVMNPENVWANDERTIMILSRRNLLTIDKTLIPDLNAHIHNTLKERIDAIRKESYQILNAIYASKEELDNAEAVMAGETESDYSIQRYGAHLEQQKQMEKELSDKFAVIEVLRCREVFLAELVDWEAKNRNIVTETRNGRKGSIGLLNFQANFRSSAARTLEAITSKAQTMIKQYETNTGKKLLVRGKRYEEFLTKQAAQVANVRTNFTHYTTDVLFFTNEEEGRDIANRVLHTDLEPIVAGRVTVPSPPRLPEHSKEVGFNPVF